jgi:NAD(P)-dependent dehydrogenase (short-subunit alcohol dehydrogenase family)
MRETLNPRRANPLSGRLALVTGANRGIGLAIARALAREGCNLIITGRDERALAKARASNWKSSRKPVEVLAQSCDVRSPDSVDYLFVLVRRLRKPLDILINNAGIGHPNRTVGELPYPTWMEVIDTNLNGLFLVTQAALAVMKRGSTIVNNLSIAAERVFPGSAAYNASKHGALGFTNTLREELRPKAFA